MKDENTCDIRLDQYGRPDIDYYLTEAHKMRQEAIAASFRAAASLLMKALGGSQTEDKGHAKARQPAAQSGWPWVDLILQDTPNRTARHS